LPTIRIWLKEHLEFEIKHYDVLPERICEVQKIGLRKGLQHFSNQIWFILDKEGAYKAMFQTLELD
jgi:hypothetical protein